jgi:hypothetical protein
VWKILCGSSHPRRQLSAGLFLMIDEDTIAKCGTDGACRDLTLNLLPLPGAARANIGTGTSVVALTDRPAGRDQMKKVHVAQ